MRYKIDKNNYIDEVYFNCHSGSCTEYTGTIPDGYDSLEEWAENANIRAYKIVEGNLVLDVSKDEELTKQYEQDAIDNSYVTHKELYGLIQEQDNIPDINDSPYTKANATGKIIKISNVKRVHPRVKLTNINCYDYDCINLVTTGKNMLPNEAHSQTISGISFTQNVDRSITLNGTSTNAIEYNIAGTSTNTSPFLCLKKNREYCLSSVGVNIKMYHYNGSDRTEVYSGNGGIIEYTDSDKLVTQITLEIPTNTTFNNVIIYPQLEYGSSTSEYETYNSKTLSFDYSEYIEEGLFPSDTLYPSDDLYPVGTTISYILIEDGNVIACINGQEVYLTEGNVGMFEGNNTIYTFQDTNIEIDYCINNLALEGTVTKNNNFKVLKDGSIEAHNGYFSGTVNATGGHFKGSITSSQANITGGLINLTGASYTVPRIITSGTGFVGYKNISKVYPDGFRIFTENGKELGQFSVIKNYNQGEYSQGCSISVNKENSDATAYMNADEIAITESGNGTYITSSSVETPILYQTSLEEHKKNIEKFDDALPIVNGIDLYKYNLKSEEDDHKKHIGFVIGENYNYSSEITAVNKEGKEIGVDNYSMASLCLQAIKELNLKIETLEKKIKELESDNSGKN